MVRIPLIESLKYIKLVIINIYRYERTIIWLWWRYIWNHVVIKIEFVIIYVRNKKAFLNVKIWDLYINTKIRFSEDFFLYWAKCLVDHFSFWPEFAKISSFRFCWWPTCRFADHCRGYEENFLFRKEIVS